MARPAGPSRDTRGAILDAALELFGTKGFTATTVKDIAARVGVKDASLYNHFPGKRAIFDALIDRELENLRVLLETSENVYAGEDTSAARMRDFSSHEDALLKSYEPFFTDRSLIALRRMLTVNQFEDKRSAQLYQTIFIERFLDLQTALIERLIAREAIARCNPRVTAYELHGPAFTLLLQDLSWTESKRRLRAHLRAFGQRHAL